MTILHMRIACWIPKATNTHLQYVMIIAFLPEQWLHEHFSTLRHTYIACPVLLTRTLLLLFSPESDSSEITHYAFLTPLLVKILFRWLVSTLDLCQQMSVIRLVFR
jgi:hypothetical protein